MPQGTWSTEAVTRPQPNTMQSPGKFHLGLTDKPDAKNIFITHCTSIPKHQINHYKVSCFYSLNRNVCPFLEIRHFSLVSEVLPFFLLSSALICLSWKLRELAALSRA